MAITPINELVETAKSKITSLSVDQTQAKIADGSALLVDIRDIRERQRGHIPGSVHCPRGMLEFWVDPESPYFKDIFSQEGKTYLFHCASGWRSAISVATLQDMGFDAAHLKDGFSGWEKAGGPVEKKAAK